MGVALLHLPTGLDFSNLDMNSQFIYMKANTLSHIHTPNAKGFRSLLLPEYNNTSDLLHVDSNLNLHTLDNETYTNSLTPSTECISNINCLYKSKQQRQAYCHDTINYLTKGGSQVAQDVLNSITVFTRKQPKGNIDVFWLYDDGGNNYLYSKPFKFLTISKSSI